MDPSPTESEPVRERLLPQTSIRFFLLIIGVCAVVMVVFRAAFVHQQGWAIIVSTLVLTVIACFLAYAVLFVLANFVTASSRPPRNSTQRNGSQGQQ